MYGLPKIHKEGIPLRPILSANNTSSYNISKYLVEQLQNLTINNYTIKNSYEFANFVKSVKHANQYTMCSFDIKSLFTNIPLNETIDICLRELFQNDNSFYLNFNKKQFNSLLQLATKNNIFMFNNVLYEQVDGVAMGSPCGPTLANVFLCFYEKMWLDSCPSYFKPSYYRRYVDDTFLLFRDEKHIELFLNYLNSKHNNIKFTKEIEQNNKLPFLDLLIIKENNEFQTAIYRKNTFTGLGINYLSFEPLKYKFNTVKTLIYRGFNLTSNFFHFDNEMRFLKTYFVKNAFPESVFYKNIKNFLDKIFSFQKNKKVNVNKKVMYINLPYYGYLSDKLKNDLQSMALKFFPHLKLNLIFKNSFSIGSMFRHKERLPSELCSSVIYKYMCALCNKCYIGSTTRQLKCRIAEHKSLSVRTNLPLSKPPFSSIMEHQLNTGHLVNSNNFNIIGSQNNSISLRLLESLFIFKLKPEMNGLSPVDLNIIR